MRGIILDFTQAKPVFDFSAPLIDFDTTVQNAMVNLTTRQGSDQLYADAGTNIQIDAARGQMINTVWANHSSNFAALAVLNFSQKTELQANPFKMQNFQLICLDLNGQSADFSITATSVNNEVVGSQVTT